MLIQSVWLFLVLAVALPQVALANKLRVYVLAGEHEMEGHGHHKTLPYLGLDQGLRDLNELMLDEKGKTKVAERVWISCLGSKGNLPCLREGKLDAHYGSPYKGPKLGPEYSMGLALEKRTAQPILLIKTAWASDGLQVGFRPPGSGHCRPELKNSAMCHDAYRLMIAHIKDVLGNIPRVIPGYDMANGYELCGMVWFQGATDMNNLEAYPDWSKPGGYNAYTDLLSAFIWDIRNELDAPEMPFVIGVIGIGGPLEITPQTPTKESRIAYFRDAMAAPAQLPFFKATVKTVFTEQCWDQKLASLFQRNVVLSEKIRQLPAGEKRQAAAMKSSEFSPEELNLMKQGIHGGTTQYLGSAAIMGKIGLAFADTLIPPGSR